MEMKKRHLTGRDLLAGCILNVLVMTDFRNAVIIIEEINELEIMDDVK